MKKRARTEIEVIFFGTVKTALELGKIAQILFEIFRRGGWAHVSVLVVDPLKKKDKIKRFQ